MNTCLPPLAWRLGSPPDIDSAEPLGEGDFCACYLVNQTHVLRLAKHAAATASIRRERLLLPHLESHLGVNIPCIEGAGIRLDTGEEFVFYPLVPGVVLWPEVFTSIDEAARSDIVRQMAEFATRLHSVPVETARSCGLKEVDPRQYFPDLMRRAGEKIAQHLDPAVWRYYGRLFELYLDTQSLNDYAPSLLHGDLSPGHFLGNLERSTLTGVIDFGDCFIGDRHRDLIFILEDYGKQMLDLFLTFYSPDALQQASLRVHIFQQLDNVQYCLTQLEEGDQGDVEEAIRTLVTQATTVAVV